MDMRRLGDSGLVVSTIGLGCNNLGRLGTATETPSGAKAVVSAALEAGVTFFDVADTYGSPRGRSEELLGLALSGRRDEAVIATKFGNDMQGANGPDFGSRAARRYIRAAVEGSLRRLATEWIDLYQLHQPDPHTPIEETLSTLHDLVGEGKIRYVGHCNLAGWQIADAAWTARSHGLTAPISAQHHYSLLERGIEAEVLPACEHYRLGLLPYFPLASGLLTGKYSATETPPEGSRLSNRPQLLAAAGWERIEALRGFAAERELTMSTVALAGLAAQPRVASVIAGATTPEQVEANAAAMTWAPDGEELAELDRLSMA